MPTTDNRLRQALEDHTGGRLEDADRLYQAILADDPDHGDALHLTGVVALQRGDFDRAITMIGRAIALSDKVPDYHNNLGEAYRAKGDLDQAIAHYRTAIALDRNQADAHNNLGLALRAKGELEQAETSYRQAIAVQPNHVQAHNNLGILLRSMGRREDAIGHYRLALAVDPDFADAHSNLGNALWAEGRRDDAFWHYRRALEADPRNAQAMINVGTALKQAGRLKESTDYYLQAAKVDPAMADAHYNLGVNLAEQGRLNDAIAAYRRAVASAPDHVKAQKNLSVALLTIGAFEEGFALWEWRWQEPGTWRRGFDFPLWEGQDLSNKSLLVWAEQGVGDELMLGTLLPEVIALAGRTLVECDPRLVPLYSRAMPEAMFVSRADPVDPAITSGAFDYQSPMGSLCRQLRRSAEDFAGPKPYLSADPERLSACKARYRDFGTALKVGIAWRSVAQAQSAENLLFKARKSSALDAWWPVLMHEGVQFFNLQYGDCAEDLAKVKRRYDVDIHQDPGIDQFQSLEDFAAQVAAMDLVITTSNTTAHMAGGLGVPVWVLLADVPDWRWQLNRDDSLWYESARLYRQSAPGDWNRLLAGVAADLGQLLESRKAGAGDRS